MQKEPKNRRVTWLLRKTCGLRLGLSRATFPRPPVIYGGARGVRGQSRPARKPLEGCLCLLTAVLLNKPDRQLLQGTMRLSGATYTVGSARRPGPFFVCRGRCPHRPEGGRRPPLRKRIFFWGASPWGNSIKGAEAPFWSFQGERVLRERGKFEIPLSLSGSLVTFCPHRKSLARRRNIP